MMRPTREWMLTDGYIGVMEYDYNDADFEKPVEVYIHSGVKTGAIYPIVERKLGRFVTTFVLKVDPEWNSTIVEGSLGIFSGLNLLEQTDEGKIQEIFMELHECVKEYEEEYDNTDEEIELDDEI